MFFFFFKLFAHRSKVRRVPSVIIDYIDLDRIVRFQPPITPCPVELLRQERQETKSVAETQMRIPIAHPGRRNTLIL